MYQLSRALIKLGDRASESVLGGIPSSHSSWLAGLLGVMSLHVLVFSQLCSYEQSEKQLQMMQKICMERETCMQICKGPWGGGGGGSQRNSMMGYLSERSMIGMRPIRVWPFPFFPLATTTSLPLMNSMSTLTSAEYVRSLNRHCCGVMPTSV